MPSDAGGRQGPHEVRASAIDNPVVFLEHKLLYPHRGPCAGGASTSIPFGQAAVKREGKDVSIVDLRPDGCRAASRPPRRWPPRGSRPRSWTCAPWSRWTRPRSSRRSRRRGRVGDRPRSAARPAASAGRSPRRSRTARPSSAWTRRSSGYAGPIRPIPYNRHPRGQHRHPRSPASPRRCAAWSGREALDGHQGDHAQVRDGDGGRCDRLLAQEGGRPGDYGRGDRRHRDRQGRPGS
ncbi:MAG: hypothetical protein M0C28_37770 [Candidatus Moduliflexus flocculans]|nr:hypothetical protein [Candidatus Moduliflexus flocculans]